MKIQSDVAGDNEKDEFLNILKTGEIQDSYKSKYAINFKFFKEKIDDFALKYSMFVSTFPQIIMKNCILLPIEADKQETALRIFSTLNDRGMALSDADIFKAQFYKFYSDNGLKQEFIENWRELEEICSNLFSPSTGSPMDELFTRYMYYERAKRGIKLSTTEALRKFYEKDNYALLKNKNTFDNLIVLADFWNEINKQSEKFSEEVLRELFVLNYAPNSMWTYFLTVYFMKNKDENNNLDNNQLSIFLKKTIGFIWGYSLTNPGVNALRTPIYSEMVNIVEEKEVSFDGFKFDEQQLRNIIKNYNFINQRPITKSMLTWWAFTDHNQKLLSLTNNYELEHIYARNRNEKEGSLTDSKNIELLGNKVLLEKRINIRASDYKFEDKKRYYYGYENRGKKVKGTEIYEILNLANTKQDFTELDILSRNELIINEFIKFLEINDLIK